MAIPMQQRRCFVPAALPQPRPVPAASDAGDVYQTLRVIQSSCTYYTLTRGEVYLLCRDVSWP